MKARRPVGRAPRLCASTVVAAVIAALALTGCSTSTTNSSSISGSFAAVLHDPFRATCTQIETPGLKEDLQFGRAIAGHYGEPGEEGRGAVPVTFSTLALAVCHKTKDKSQQPAEAIEGIATEVAQISQETGTSFGAALTTLVLGKTKNNEIYGVEQVKAAQAFASQAADECKRAKHGIARLLEKLAEPGEFKTSDAATLEHRFAALRAVLTRLANAANLSNTPYLAEFDHSAKELTGIMRHLARLDENEEDIAQAAIYQSNITPKQIKLDEEANAVDACGELFDPTPEPEPEITG